MDFIQVVLLVGFVETVILFLYALRWYLFTFVSLKSMAHGSSTGEEAGDLESSFVSVLLPVYNEPNVVDRLLRACTSFNSPPYEVIVIDDSKDDTRKRLEAWLNHPKVRVLHRGSRDGWKGGALNFGLENVNPKSTHVLIFDADFAPPQDLVDRFLTRFNHPRIAAVQGYQCHDLNADENWVTKGVRAWHSLYNMVELNGLAKTGTFSPLTGSVCMLRTDVIQKLRFKGVMTEDTELTARLYENGYRVLYDPTLRASGECPNTLRRWFRQQMRWAEGHTRVFRQHFLRILRSRFLGLTEKANFLFVGFSFLNSVLILVLMATCVLTSIAPAHYLPMPLTQAGFLLIMATMPSAILASLAALSMEGSRRDYRMIPYAWFLNLISTPALAYASLKGLLTNNNYFHRTYKTGKILKT